MKDIEIKEALIERFMTLNEYSGIEFLNDDNVMLPNENKKEPADKRYFRLNVIAGEPENVGMYNDGNQRYNGIFQIDIYTPKGKGDKEADTKFKWICKLFQEGSCFDGIIVDKVYRANVMEASDKYATIVRVRFNADVDNNQ